MFSWTFVFELLAYRGGTKTKNADGHITVKQQRQTLFKYCIFKIQDNKYFSGIIYNERDAFKRGESRSQSLLAFA